ncbi:hypothetical protein JTE90_006235 [Oedothorax gibbosus]|uniref:Nucleolus and neural progenitor protein-like N-terminal domain-containing protein n=1 Tax=Oedothorax gibbosus TaxID=931172 RepID=A0AAV6VW12_9ARAC|nr:hypothetical protein JTE90_006235 [Oedothorax gibbosus]
MWKQMNLPNPSNDMCEYESADDVIINLHSFVGLLTSSAEILTADNQLWTEIKVFENVQAKYKRILHCDKCLQLLQRVGIYLRKMVLLNLSKSYLDLAEPFLKGLQSEESKRLLPSRQQLEYVLIRTQSAAKLICEAIHYSRETFCYLIPRLKIGHWILNLTMAASVTARLHILFKGILALMCDFYLQVYKWLDKLKEGTFKWPLPIDLPEDLQDWLLSEGDLSDHKQLPTEQLSFLKDIFEKQKGKSKAKKDMVIDIATDDEECTVVKDSTEQNEDVDFGEVVSRDTSNMEIVSREPEIVSSDSECIEVVSTDVENSEINSINEDHANGSTKEENMFLQKIKKVKTYKQLLNILKNIEEWSNVGAIPKLTEKRRTKVMKMFVLCRQEMKDIKRKLLTEDQRKQRNKKTIKKYKAQFCKLLRLSPKQPGAIEVSPAISENIRQPRNLTELINLYNNLYFQLDTAKATKKCCKLKKMFKSQKSDIKLLLKNGENGLAKQLIACTTKILLTKYVI